MTLSSYLYVNGQVIEPADLRPGDWVTVKFDITWPMFRHDQPPRTLCEWRVAFMNANYDCREVIITAFSKRHAKKLARKICRIKQWLGVTRND